MLTFFCYFTATAIIKALSLHDALPICSQVHRAQVDRRVQERVLPDLGRGGVHHRGGEDRKSTRLNCSHVAISYAVFGLKKKKKGKRILIMQRNRRSQTVAQPADAVKVT